MLRSSRPFIIRGFIGLVCSFTVMGSPSDGVAAPDGGEPKVWEPDLGDPSWTRIPPSYAAICRGAVPVAFNAVTEAATITGDRYQVWFTFAADQGDLLTLGTTFVRPEENTDTYLSLVSDDCRTTLAENDDDGPGRHALIYRFSAPYTGKYSVQVRGFGPQDRGRYRAYFMRTKPPAVILNDRCDGAVALPRCHDLTVQGDLTTAEGQYDLAIPGPSPTGFPSSGRDATYSLDLRQGDRVALDCTMPKDDACVYLVSDCVDVSRNCLAWSDSGISGDKEAIDWVVPASGRYFLIVDSYGKNAGGPFTLNLSFACVTPRR